SCGAKAAYLAFKAPGPASGGSAAWEPAAPSKAPAKMVLRVCRVFCIRPVWRRFGADPAGLDLVLQELTVTLLVTLEKFKAGNVFGCDSENPAPERQTFADVETAGLQTT
ncbi:MAG: hypothetical protein Q7T70_02415, partial [Polaromonas sp.]|nr:hypothetical protein [Polaromonas sp.]